MRFFPQLMNVLMLFSNSGNPFDQFITLFGKIIALFGESIPLFSEADNLLCLVGRGVMIQSLL